MQTTKRTTVNKGRCRGFIYLWILLVVALVGLGLTLGAEVYRTSLQREQETALLSIGHEFRAALRSYYVMPIRSDGASALSRYPARLEDLLHDPRFASTKRYLRQIYVDPVTGHADWGLVKVGERIVGIYSLSRRIAIKQSNFEPDDLILEGKTKISEWTFTYPADMRIGQMVTPPNR